MLKSRDKIKVLCEKCNIELLRNFYKVKKAKHIFCESCAKEYNRERMRKWNIKNNPLEWHRKTALKFKNHPNYKGFSKRPDGYVRIALGGDTRKLYHRYLIEQKLGRKLLPSEIIHHKDGNPSNNKINNLEIMTQNKHAQLHLTKYADSNL